jgi:hypothetical protein
MYWNFVAIDGVIKNQLDKYATGCNTQRWKLGLYIEQHKYLYSSHAHKWFLGYMWTDESVRREALALQGTEFYAAVHTVSALCGSWKTLWRSGRCWIVGLVPNDAYLRLNSSQAFYRHSEWIILIQPRIHEEHVARVEEMSENIPLKIPKEGNNLW